MSAPAITRYEKHKYNAEKAEAHYLVMAAVHGERHNKTKQAHARYMRQLKAMCVFGKRAPVHGSGVAAVTSER